MVFKLTAKERESPQRREEGVMAGGGGNVISGRTKKMDFFYVLLELPVIDKGLFPFRNKLTLKLLGELHHLSLYLDFPKGDGVLAR